jgi:hypothetical protein
MDKFDQIFEIQKKFTEKFFETKFDNKFLSELKNKRELLVKWNKEYIISIIKETTELLDEIDWKMHLNKLGEDNRENFLEESIDIMKYLFGLLIINEFSVEDIYKKFIDKSFVVEAKLKQNEAINKIRKNNKRKIAIIDIDGVIFEYPENLINFVNAKLNEDFNNIKSLKNKLGKNFYIIKKEFRNLGFESDGNVKEFAKSFLNKLSEKKYFIILLTARPYKKFFRIYADTFKWLEKNEILFDAIIWEDKKADFIVNNFNNLNIKFCIDDDIENCNKFATCFETYFLKNKKLFFNENELTEKINFTLDKNVKIIDNLSQIRI